MNVNNINNQITTLMAQETRREEPVTTRLNDLVREIDPTAQIDEEVQDVLSSLAEEFLDQVIKGSCFLAKHRQVPTVEIKDVQLYLERSFNMWLPGFGTEEIKPYRRPAQMEAHKQRLTLIRRALKKY